MESPEYAVLSREVRAIEIPQGTPAVLDAGTHVRITQQLGGSYTVMSEYGQLLRIDPKDADAIGKEVAAGMSTGAGGATGADADDTPLADRVWSELRTCYDPEIPVNIVDLGLVYNCEVVPLPEGGNRVDIKMTLTAPGCGMGPVLASDVKSKVEALPGVAAAEVEVVWDPQWNQNMMSEAARLQLGFF
jgi:probable FeS assembly SUF system protein SufT